ncbi:citryl-CoA lyase [Bordetella genomosp. 13]|uniref:citryl-CoA lyase n=1 Tax=Bordetella genomosp. 13 TaxID=463040 RepID=UPI00119CB2A6|nr:citryl-CoA lyase [Bordetella genomosp. 13]
MKIGKTTVPRTSISTSDEHTIVVRGQDLCQDLIGKISFTDYFHLLLTGRRPDAAATAVIDATLVAIAEHGLVPSVQASRMTLAAAPDALQGAVAAGILGCGSVILGASETAGRMFHEIEARAKADGTDNDEAALAVLQEYRAARRAIPGYGHPLHKERDPRVGRLFDVAREAGASLAYIDIAEAVERAIPQVLGKELKLNVSAAIPAVLLGVGFPLLALKGVPILARTAGLIAHLNEELEQSIGFALSYQAAREVQYDGELPAGFGTPPESH